MGKKLAIIAAFTAAPTYGQSTIHVPADCPTIQIAMDAGNPDDKKAAFDKFKGTLAKAKAAKAAGPRRKKA